MGRKICLKAVLLLSAVAFSLGQGCPSPAEPGDDTPGDQTTPIDGPTIEPDDYADETVLTSVSPLVTLSTALDDNSVAALFEVTADTDNFDFAPTGEKVFGHSNIGFFNSDRRLRMDFPGGASSIQITFAGGTFFETEVGLLQAYDANDNLVAEYQTAPLGPGDAEIMTVTSAGGGIAWAVAYAQEGNSFGRLDHLVFSAGAGN